MRSSRWKSFCSFVVPGGLVFLAAIGFLRPSGLPGWLQHTMAIIPPVVLGLGLLLGWYFSSSRMILTLLVLALADRALVIFPQSTGEADAVSHIVFNAAAFLVPLNLLALSLTREEAISTFRGVLRLSLILIQPFLVLWLCLPKQAELAASLELVYLSPSLTTWTTVPQPALLAFAGTVVLQLARFVSRRDPLEGGFFWGLLASLFAFHGIQFGWRSTNFFTAAGVILFTTLLQASYRRTYRDELTGMQGRVAYQEAVKHLGRRYAVAVVGIDQLKHYANAHGKFVGDQLLRLVANKVAKISGGGKVFRPYGEEFIILFRGKSVTDTLAPLEGVRMAVGTGTFWLRGGDQVWENVSKSLHGGSRDESLPLSLSIGVVEKSTGKATVKQVVKAAYRALYEAKNDGGNMVRRGRVPEEHTRASPESSGKIVSSGEFELH